MAALLTSKIDHVDEALYQLTEYRRACDDPGDILRATESIDQWLDRRLDLTQATMHQDTARTETSTTSSAR